MCLGIECLDSDNNCNLTYYERVFGFFGPTIQPRHWAVTSFCMFGNQLESDSKVLLAELLEYLCRIKVQVVLRLILYCKLQIAKCIKGNNSHKFACYRSLFPVNF